MNKSPEPIILAIALGLLALGSAGLAYMFPTAEDITGVTRMEPKEHSPKALKPEDIDTSLASWTSPTLWEEPADKQRLFISDEYLFYPSLYPAGNYIQKNDGTARTPGGVLLSWYQKYGLDFTDSNIDREDPDKDGFSNIQEFMNAPVGVRLKASDCDGTQSTNPLDPQSHPSYLSLLRLQTYERRSFHIQFRGKEVLNGEHVFQIRLSDVPSNEQPGYKKTGDKLGAEGYIIGPYTENIVEEVDKATGIKTEVDKSTLELDKPEIGFKILLPYRQEIDSPESTADFVMLTASEIDKVWKVPRGKILKVPYITDTTYLVLEANDNGATIRDTTTQKEYHILKLDPAEWDEVLASPANSTKMP